MTTPTIDEVTNGEIVRTLRSLQDDIRALRGEHVRRDLYEAQRAAQAAELARIEERCRTDVARIEAAAKAREAERLTMRRQVFGALLAGVVALLAQFVMIVVGG